MGYNLRYLHRLRHQKPILPFYKTGYGIYGRNDEFIPWANCYTSFAPLSFPCSEEITTENLLTVSKAILKIMKGVFIRVIIWQWKQMYLQNQCLFQKEQIVFLLMMEVIKCNQIVTRWLACSFGRHYHIGGSMTLSVVDMLLLTSLIVTITS